MEESHQPDHRAYMMAGAHERVGSGGEADSMEGSFSCISTTHIALLCHFIPRFGHGHDNGLPITDFVCSLLVTRLYLLHESSDIHSDVYDWPIGTSPCR